MITREMIENGFKTSKKGYRKGLSIMKYNKADEEYINMLVTERYWKDIKKCFKKDADDSLKRIHYNGNWYQCRMADGEFCIGAKDICNPERLDLTEGYRKDLSVMKYNRMDEENINNVVTGMRWRDIKDIFKRNADNETKRIHFGSNYYQCRMNKDGFCIGAKDICNPEMLDLTRREQEIPYLYRWWDELR